MQIIKNPEISSWEALIKRPLQKMQTIEAPVRKILADVRTEGDKALISYTEKFDGITGVPIVYRIPSEEISLSDRLRSAIKVAFENIQKFHLSQREETSWVETMPGVRCSRRSTPIDKVGLYIPGGTAPLFSSLLMLAIPAKLAGCKQIIICTPPQSDGTVHPAIVYIAQLIGIEEIYLIGGAQAIAAMAYGTESVPKVYKILGPGNQYVTMAKQLVSTEVAIDFPAGPSELAIMADQKANPDFLAADLLSQAEHGPDSQVVLVTDSEALIEGVTESLQQQLSQLPRKEIAKQALEESKILIFDTLEPAMDFINLYAPEHLILNVTDAGGWIDSITNAGSVFMGAYTPESAGDYASGTNHTLPTNGNARMYAGVSLDTFVKKITYQEISPEGLEALGDTIESMAEAEGLEAHSRAVSIRRKYKPKE